MELEDGQPVFGLVIRRGARTYDRREKHSTCRVGEGGRRAHARISSTRTCRPFAVSTTRPVTRTGAPISATGWGGGGGAGRAFEEDGWGPLRGEEAEPVLRGGLARPALESDAPGLRGEAGGCGCLWLQSMTADPSSTV